MPGSSAVESGRVTSTRSRLMMNAVEEEPSVTAPSSIIQASATPASAACCLARTCASRATDLMSRRFQRRSSTVITLAPVSASGLASTVLAWVNITTVGSVPAFGKAKSRSATPRVTCM